MSSRSWGWRRCCGICRGCCACARRCAATLRRRPPGRVRRHRRPGLQSAPRAAAQGAPASRTVQYVSPQVWAWRQGRVRTHRRCCDLVLCLLPFETEFYTAARRARPSSSVIRSPIRSRSVSIAPRRARRSRSQPAGAADRAAARQPRRRSDAPRGRRSPRPAALDRRRIARATSSLRRWPRAAIREIFASAVAQAPGAPAIRLLDGQAQQALAAADAALVASGTATLETLLRSARWWWPIA